MNNFLENVLIVILTAIIVFFALNQFQGPQKTSKTGKLDHIKGEVEIIPNKFDLALKGVNDSGKFYVPIGDIYQKVDLGIGAKVEIWGNTSEKNLNIPAGSTGLTYSINQTVIDVKILKVVG